MSATAIRRPRVGDFVIPVAKGYLNLSRLQLITKVHDQVVTDQTTWSLLQFEQLRAETSLVHLEKAAFPIQEEDVIVFGYTDPGRRKVRKVTFVCRRVIRATDLGADAEYYTRQVQRMGQLLRRVS